RGDLASHGRGARAGPGEAARPARGSGGPPHSDRVPAARRAGPERGEGADALAPAASRVGARLCAPEPLSARLHDPAPAQARGGPGAAQVAPDGAGRGISAVRSLIGRAFTGSLLFPAGCITVPPVFGRVKSAPTFVSARDIPGVFVEGPALA